MSRLPEHLHPPTIVETVVRYECPKCGNNCQCGVPYVPKTARATEYAEKNPTASVREIVEQTGVGHGTAQEAKARVRGRTPQAEYPPDWPHQAYRDETVTGRDGKTYPATKPPTDGPPPDLTAEAKKHLDKIVNLLRQMNQRERLSFRTAALQQITDAYLDENVIEF